MAEDVVGLRYISEGLPETLQGIQQYTRALRGIGTAEAQAARGGQQVAASRRAVATQTKDAAQIDAAWAKQVRQNVAIRNQSARMEEQAIRAIGQQAQQQMALRTRSAQMEQRAIRETVVLTQQEQREKAQLAAAYNPLLSASLMYNRVVEELNRAQQIGVITDRQRQQSLAALHVEHQQFIAGAATGNNRFLTSTNQASLGLNQMGVVLQQTGYQVGDFFVQVQSGTNPMVAFGQQATQLVGILPLMTGAFGLSQTALIGLSAGLGILIPVLTAGAAWFMRTADSASQTATALEKLDDDVSTLGTSLTKIQEIRLGGIAREFAQQAENAKRSFSEILGILERVETRTLRATLAAPLNTVIAELRAFEVQQNLQARVGGSADFESALGLESRAQALFLAQQLRRLDGETREELAAQVEQISQALTLRGIMTTQVEQMLVSLADQLDIQQQIEDAAKRTESEHRDIYQRLQDITGLDLKGMYTKAADAVTLMNTRLDSTLRKIQGILGAIGSIGFETVALQAETRALQAGQTAAQANVEGRLAQQRATLEQSGTAEPLIRAAELGMRTALEAQMAAQRARDAALNDPRRATRPQMRPMDFDAPAGGAGSGGASRAQEDYLASLVREAELKKESVGVSDQEARYLEIVSELRKRDLLVNGQLTEAQRAQIDTVLGLEEATRMLTEAENQRQTMMDTVQSNLENAFMSLIDGSKSVRVAFANMLQGIANELFKQSVAEPLAGFIGGLFFNANGNAFQGGNVIPFANGGIVSSPTTFPMAGSNTGLMGEAGPEAIMPLRRGRDGKLGVAAESDKAGGEIVLRVVSSEGTSVEVIRNTARVVVREETPNIVGAVGREMARTSAFGSAG